MTTGRRADITVRVVDSSHGMVNGWMLDLGDGRVIDSGFDKPYTHMCPLPEGTNLSPSPDAPIDQTMTIPYSYRRAGGFRVVARARTGYCPEDWVSSEGATSVVVAPGDTPSNGPVTPTIRLGLAQAPPKIEMTKGVPDQEFVLSDPDGFISELEVDWGDDHRDTVRFPLSECTDPAGFWPKSFRRVRHRYREDFRTVPSTAVPTVDFISATVTSSGCDGQDRQEVTFPPEHWGHPEYWSFDDHPAVLTS